MSEPTCREERRSLGLAYPRSSCQQCGSLIRPGWQCAKAQVESKAFIEALTSRVTALVELGEALRQTFRDECDKRP